MYIVCMQANTLSICHVKQVDRLLVSKMVESISMATTSLISLVQLLDKVKNMVISDHIQQEVSAKLSLFDVNSHT